MSKYRYIVFYPFPFPSCPTGYVLRQKSFSSWSKANRFKVAQETLGLKCDIILVETSDDGICCYSHHLRV